MMVKTLRSRHLYVFLPLKRRMNKYISLHNNTQVKLILMSMPKPTFIVPTAHTNICPENLGNV